MKDYSYVFNAHPSYIESLYRSFRQNPASVDEGWRVFFEGFEFNSNGHGISDVAGHEAASGLTQKDFGVMSLIYGYRNRGHLLSTTNPIKPRRDRKPFLDLADYGLEESDRNTVFSAGTELGLKDATLDQIVDKLRSIYCGTIGFEYNHIENLEKRKRSAGKVQESNP